MFGIDEQASVQLRNRWHSQETEAAQDFLTQNVKGPLGAVFAGGSQPVPIVPFIDEKLHKNRGDGYRYEGMPPMREAWRQGIKAIDDEARARRCGTITI